MAHSVTLNWTAPAGSTVTNYIVLRSGPAATAAAAQAGTFTSVGTPSATTFVDNGPFTEGQFYAYEVEASNSAGNSTPVEVVEQIPFSVPGPVTGLVATVI